MSLPSLKKDLINSFAFIPSMEELKDNKLTIVTALGMITGTLAKADVDNFDDKNQVAAALLTKMSEYSISDYLTKNSLDDEQLLEGNDGFISLTDVTIQTSNSTFKLAFLNVFFDQIIGVTVSGI